jgi:hypothetical protein
VAARHAPSGFLTKIERDPEASLTVANFLPSLHIRGR